VELSIIVSAYNMAEDTRLENCLNSLLEQTISDYEIIAVDDASTDGTSQILLDFAALYPDVFKVIQSQTHKGRGGARNMGMKHARGKWLAFVESWDQVAPTMYEKLLAKANDTGADLVGCGYCITSEDTDSQAECVQIWMHP
jgi:glycosyltransferase involved in cell wall biosynthesis